MAVAVALAKTNWLANPARLNQMTGEWRKDMVSSVARCEPLSNTVFVVISDPTGKPGGALVVAVNRTGAAHITEGLADFRKALKADAPRLRGAGDALALAGFYAQLFATPFPQGWQSVKILNDAKEIDGIEPSEAGSLNKVVRPPTVRETSGSYAIEFYTWSPLGGNLLHWKCSVSAADMQAGNKLVKASVGRSYLPK